MQRDKEDDEEMCKLVLSHTNSINLFNTMFLPVLIATTIETKKLRSDKTNIRRLIKKRAKGEIVFANTKVTLNW